MLKKLKGQTALEYSVLMSVVVAAVVGMQIYLKHSYEGRLRVSSDDVGKQSDVMGLEVDITRNSTSKSIELSRNGNTYTYMGYNQTGMVDSGNFGDEQISKVKQDSTEKIDGYTTSTPLF